MGRTKRVEGSVREVHAGSGLWQARLPKRLDPYRRPLGRTFRTEMEARRALNAEIAARDSNQKTGLSGRPTGKVRRVRDVVEEYIDARKRSRRAPIAVHTVRSYKGALAHQINHPRADVGKTPTARLTPMVVSEWMEDLARAGVHEGSITAARRVLSAALSWEVSQGRMAVNPVKQVRRETSKASRAESQTADVVLLPSWSEFVTLVSTPARDEDRLLIALLGWAGLRWSEAVALDERAVWRDRPSLTIARVLVKRTITEVEDGEPEWVAEPPKGGLTATVPLPTPLWERLVRLADQRKRQRPKPAPAGRLLFQASADYPDRGGIGLIDASDFRKRVWIPARKAANLNGDDTLPDLDPRRNPIKIKDLRAFAASVLRDAGSSETEASALLRHADVRTTQKHYARSMHDRAHDKARRAVAIDTTLSLTERLDALWAAWVTGFPEVGPKLGIEVPTGRRRGQLRAVK